MAEMTAAEAVKLLKEFYPWDEDSEEDMKQIASLIEQQAAEIANKDRMLESACKLISKTGCPGLEDVYCDENCKTEMNSSYCWLKWLEKEAEGVE